MAENKNEEKQSFLQTLSENIKYIFSDEVVNKVEEPFDTEVEKDVKENATTHFGDKTLQDTMDIDVITGTNYTSLFLPTYASEQTIDELIKLYRTMGNYSYVNMAIGEIVNAAIVQTDDVSDIVKIDFNDNQDKVPKKIKDSIINEFNTLMTIIDFDNIGSDLFRQWYTDGRLLLQIVVKPDKLNEGIVDIIPMSPFNLKRHYNKKEKKTYYVYDEDKAYDGYGKKMVQLIPEDLVVFVPSGIYESEKRVPISYLHFAIKDVNRLNTLEDHFLIYRIVRSPERRVFYIDPGQMPPKKAEEYLKQVIATYRQKKIFDENTGTIQGRIKHPSLLEDFFLLRREGKGTEITTIGDSNSIQSIDDLLYFQRKASRSLKVPFSRINYEDRKDVSTYSNTTEVNMEEYRFMRFIHQLRSKFNKMFFELLKRQIVFKNIVKIDEWEQIKKYIKIIWRNDDNFMLDKKLGTLEKKLTLLSTATQFEGKYLSRESIFKNVMAMTEEEIEVLEKQITEEKSKYKNETEEGGGGGGLGGGIGL